MAVVALPLAASAGAASAGLAAGGFAATALATAATFAGAVIDSALLNAIQGPIKNQVSGPRLDNARIQTSIEGSPIYRAFGRTRIGGQVFWASRFLETETTETQTVSGGKGFGGRSQETTSTTYTYSVSMAIGLCEGPILKIGRIWADGKPLDLTDVTYRVYKGSETQTVDPKIAAVEGADFAPAHRGLAYIVFEDLPLQPFGNRIPQFNIEVISLARTDQAELEYQIPGMNIIPGAGEYVYDDRPIKSTGVTGGDATQLGWILFAGDQPTEQFENMHNPFGVANWELSMDDMVTVAPNLTKAQLVVSWFGSDLRLQNCEIRPKVETYDKLFDDTANWFVSGVDRANAQLTSSDALGPLLGGAPADVSVYLAIQDLNARGLDVAFYPFILMDIPSGNTLPDPYSNNAASIGQSTFPWRGRIVPSPAPGFTGSPDQTAAVSTHMDTFFGTCTPAHFSAWNGITIPYTGPNEWSYRRFILHYARLCAQAGGVDTFYIGTEMVAMTQARSAAGTYPAIAKLQALAADVASILPGANISYAADWSEYHSHRPADGSNDVYFNMDPLWADANIDFISIDNYLPTSDWRDTPDHLDALTYDYIYDLAYHKANIEGGEYYDYFYASSADRISQTRTPINDTDPADEDWVFRQKDLKNWWQNAHHNRPGGTRSGSPTGWTAESKPIVFSELGCPAIDKGSNQPNVFFDPKSAESFFPYFSTGARDDYIQRIYNQAWLEYWASAAGNNPTSSVYSDLMVDIGKTALWTWDARPYPYFPQRTDIWRDGDNWRLGHWLNGRLGQVALPDLLTRLLSDLGLTGDVTGLFGLVTGYTLDRVMSARDAIEPLSLAYIFDSYESDGQIKFRHRGGTVDWTLTEAELVPLDSRGSTYRINRKMETELPDQSLITFIEEASEYQQAVVQSKRLVGNSTKVANTTVAIVSDREKMQKASDTILMDAWLQRESVQVILPPKMLAADPTDIVNLTLAGRANEFRIEEISQELQRPATLVRTDRGLYHSASAPEVSNLITEIEDVVAALIDFVDIPLTSDNGGYGPHLALYSDPWQENNIYRSPLAADFTLDNTVKVRSHIGVLAAAIVAGPEGEWDFGTEIQVTMISAGVPESREELAILNGKNACAIKSDNGDWEVIQFVNAELVSGNTYKLTKLLRAQLGTDDAMNAGAAIGAQFVLLDGLLQSSAGVATRGIEYNWKYGPASRPISDTSYKTVVYAPKAYGLRPYSPVNLKAVRAANNDTTLSWFRRCRLPEAGDSWEGLDVPLGEEIEQYEVDIYDAAGTTILRTITVNDQTSTVYTEAEQIADHGSVPSSIDFEVYQLSRLFGRGTGRRAEVSPDASGIFSAEFSEEFE